jgi:transcriptional regulator with XRE-family HTH domain
MNWNSETIRELRLRLGFCASDLARRLQCESTEVYGWEQGYSSPIGFQLQQLDLLQKQAEAMSAEVSATPLADHLLEADDLGQIHVDEVRTRFSENN